MDDEKQHTHHKKTEEFKQNGIKRIKMRILVKIICEIIFSFLFQVLSKSKVNKKSFPVNVTPGLQGTIFI